MKFQNILICVLAVNILASCNSGSSKTAAPQDEPNIMPVPEEIVYTKTKPEDIKRECSATEAKMLSALDKSIKVANASIDKNDEMALMTATSTINSCDQVIEALGTGGACFKKLIETSYYDQYRVNEACKKTEKYLVANNARPPKNQTPPPIATPPTTKPPVVTQPPVKPPVVTTPPPVVTPGSMRQCTKDEFAKLSEMAGALNQSTASIKNLGKPLKYDAKVIDDVTGATKACESRILYHDQQPCEYNVKQDDGSKILKQYTGAILRQRCEESRTYFYEYYQNKKSLNFANADLYIDFSNLSPKVFELQSDEAAELQGCRVEMIKPGRIDYSARGLVSVKDSRGSTDDQMMVLETTEGLKVLCYGMGFSGGYSKSEVENKIHIPLIYKLK